MKLFSSMLLLFLFVMTGFGQKRKTKELVSSFKRCLIQIEKFSIGLAEILCQRFLKFSKTSVKVKHAFLLSTLFVTVISSNHVFSQHLSSDAQQPKVLKKEEVDRLDKERMESIQSQQEFARISNEISEQYFLLRKMGVRDFPNYPELITNETLLNYLKELQKVSGFQSNNSSKP